MRWFYKDHERECGSKHRVVRKFLWLPTLLKYSDGSVEWAWLERAYFSQYRLNKGIWCSINAIKVDEETAAVYDRQIAQYGYAP